MTFRGVRILREVDRIACEDTRVTRRLCDHFGVDSPLIRHEAHNEAASTEGILALLDRGESVALVSDAGTPCINDPGQRLIAQAIAAAHPVIPIPGPSSLIAALCASGLPTERFMFHGFIPKKARAWREMLSELETGTHALFCPARDLPSAMGEIAAFAPLTEVVIAREITKRHETWLRGSAAQLAAELEQREAPRGEAVVLIHLAPKGDEDITDEDIIEALAPLVTDGVRKKEAAAQVAERLGVSKRRVYQLSIAL